ncbi:MAG: hypothetical protein FJ118_00460 [Deltaproteobacteria bacterium]|nr:hypothetical protein [Deltaproteobacteria bacterium]
MSFPLKEQALQVIYDLYDREARRFPVACRQECSTCCTHNVLATTLEVAHTFEEFTEDRLQELATPVPPNSWEGGLRPQLTVNHLAGYCLLKKEPPAESLTRSAAPCPFRNAHGCGIYETRPFACRSMWSRRVCPPDGKAEMPALLVTLNGAIFQILEHLDAKGLYGNLLDLFELFDDSDVRAAYEAGEELEATASLLKTQPNPGFIVPPEHRQDIARVIGTLWSCDVGGLSFREALSQLRPGH